MGQVSFVTVSRNTRSADTLLHRAGFNNKSRSPRSGEQSKAAAERVKAFECICDGDRGWSINPLTWREPEPESIPQYPEGMPEGIPPDSKGALLRSITHVGSELP